MNLFPFTAIVGLEQAKQSLIYHAIDPRIGGSLLLGHRGCAKSTLVRSFSSLLCRDDGQMAPFCEVPLGTTEDRLLGSVDPERLVERQQWRLRAGLLEQSHQGILYIDEVNLLPDHLSDLILDSAASGIHRIERDGITRVVESRYVLVATMNPEEGELRPQLLDRFAHGVHIKDNFSENQRAEILRNRLAFDDEPEKFIEHHQNEIVLLRKNIEMARGRLKAVSIHEELRCEIARQGREFKGQGMRAELSVLRTARCMAAWNNRMEILPNDLQEAWALCLGHRRNEAESPKAPPSPNQPPTTGSTASNSDGGRARSHSSSSPTEARSQPISLSLGTTSAPDGFLQRWKWATQSVRKVTASRYVSNSSSTTPILWLRSVLASVEDGWLSERRPLRLCRARPTTNRTCWIYLDASRSTGMSGFLARSLALIKEIAQKGWSRRVHLMVFRDNRAQWICRHRSWSTVQAVLKTITSASGGSNFVSSLVAMNRSLQRQRHSLSEVLLFTDGFNSRLPHEDITQSLSRLKVALYRVRASASAFAWLYPKPLHPALSLLAQNRFAEFEEVRWPL